MTAEYRQYIAHRENEVFCGSCQQWKPLTDYYFKSNGKITLPCKVCHKILVAKPVHAVVFKGNIKGEPSLKRCVGPGGCGKVLPIEKFRWMQTGKYRHTICTKCNALRWDQTMLRWKRGHDGFRVCDVCHIDKPPHHYPSGSHTCYSCAALKTRGVFCRDAYEQIRREARARRFSCT